MITLGEYTKEQMAAELCIKGDKASHLTDKLKKLGYSFETSGKARNYRIYITRLPQMGVKQFAEQYLGISARFEDRLTHFLQLLFTSGRKEEFVNMSATSLEWLTYSNNDTIQDWLESLIDCGLLVEDDLVEVYYATQREIVDENDNNGDYDYTQKIKFITKAEYDKAITAYSDRIKSFGEISKNPDVALDEAVFSANVDKRDALDGWWAMRKKANYKIEINYEWPHLTQLLSLLESKDVQEYHRLKRGNYLKDLERFEERVAKWEEEKAEKRRKLDETAAKEAEFFAKKKVMVDNTMSDTPPAKIRDNSEVPVCDSFVDYVEQMKELFLKTKKGLYDNDERI